MIINDSSWTAKIVGNIEKTLISHSNIFYS